MRMINLFEKDINRTIETVIKADDQDHILEEVVEYVVTREVSRKISDFFSSYIDYQGANGVWISGFFGSGKSHLLKILSYILENREYDGYRLGEYFTEKIENDPMLKGDILAATRIPSESILFNIDQQAQITSKQQEDALLNVFYKVFYDNLGYFGAQHHVAEFERWLDSEKVYRKFQEEYEATTGEFWTNARRKYFAPKVKEAIGIVLSKLMGDTPDKYSNIIETLRGDARVSVDDFCNKVAEYIKTKPRGFRLNFFVDEVGQYISDNSRLMLNLQTIAETLAVKTKGNSWILVTSQEDMESIVGDMNKSQQNDFSKIQARFKIKIPLTSANVDEVIEKRLLSKNEPSKNFLTAMWHRESANLESLLSFSDSGVQFKKFKDEQDFINKYPFIVYQFDLFQQCIRALSIHNAFQGKHASVGERSMLGVFQHVIQHIDNDEETALVSFDMLFEGIRSTIRGELQNAITLAEKNLDDKFAIQVLKALFMVKYYSNFKTTIKNISVLMICQIRMDLKEHEKKTQLALNLLENQTYIQRNGDIYEYLTDDEKDIEQEIKSTDIDNQKVTEFFKEILFDEIIQETKIRFAENKQDYDFTSKIDGMILGKEKELIVEIITPNFVDHNREMFFRSQTMGFSTLLMIVLPIDNHILMDARMCMKTDKYIKLNQSYTNKENVKRILFEKQQLNSARKKVMSVRLRQLLGEADVYMNGMKQPMSNVSDGKTKLVNAFQNLVKLAYPSLSMVSDTVYTEEVLKAIIKNHQDDLFGNDDSTLSEAESEMLNVIQRRKSQSDRTSLTDIKEFFTRRPYGWYPNAIWGIVARLYKRGKVEFRQDASLLDDDHVLNSLMNNRFYGNTLLEPQIDIDPKLIKQLITVYQEFSDESCPAKEAKEVALAFREKLKETHVWLNQMLIHQVTYPFLKLMLPALELIDRLIKKEYTYYLTNIADYEDELLNHKESLIDPIKRFWNGEQRKIFDSIMTILNGNQSNLEYIEGHEIEALRRVIEHPKPFTGDIIKDAKAAKDELQHRVSQLIEEERAMTRTEIDAAKQRVETHADFASLDDSLKREMIKPFEEELRKLNEQRYIANMRVTRNTGIDKMLRKQLEMVNELSHPPKENEEKIKVNYLSVKNVKFHFPKTELQDADDVENYAQALKKALMVLISQNKRISL